MARHTCFAVQAAELHFPDDKARLTGRLQAALAFALQHADRVVRLGCLAALPRYETPVRLISAGSLRQLAAFQRLAELNLGFLPLPIDEISLLPRGLRTLTLHLRNW